MTISVHFILLPGFALLDLAGPAEALRISQRYVSDLTLHYAGPVTLPLCSLGMTLQDTAPLPDSLPPNAWLIIPGFSTLIAEGCNSILQQIIVWLEEVLRPDVRLVCIYSAVLLVGAAGLLDDRPCTIHHTLVEQLKQVAPAARVKSDRIFVIDRNIATSAGVTTGIDLTLELIARQFGPKVAVAVSRDMVIWRRRDGDTPQLSPFQDYRDHMHPAIHRVQDAIAAEPAGDWSLDSLAAIACVSTRHLARLFKLHIGIAPLDYRQRMQLANIEPLLRQKDYSLEKIAEIGGFGSARDLRRVWRKQRGEPLPGR
ncbi:GlxA family transcriptional regulator [Chitinimonas sp. BJB300]|uniref:GlxA family transcriptional regulator n=1 Tax=Chitinimonas sp. BJB300 TaxID=1559339 RepID=UPI000C0CDBDA|nr:helix-turn-helix domain-containing protein [Chitinimonas sp. BJB300]PHV13303.1 AraC family transcriptional regulator [Chitinimonas sp. BJB300]TSJ85992.1 helix-turn-helix domain-containing protein [Chitinimonas sp. BJB300]